MRLVDDVLRVVESGQVGAGRLDAVSWFVVVFGWVWWHGHGPDLHSGQGPGLVWRALAGAAVDYVYLASTRAEVGKNRLHLDLYPTGRDNALPMLQRIEIVEAKVAELVDLGARVQRRTRHDDPDDPVYFVVMHDPEGNEFCVG